MKHHLVCFFLSRIKILLTAKRLNKSLQRYLKLTKYFQIFIRDKAMIETRIGKYTLKLLKDLEIIINGKIKNSIQTMTTLLKFLKNEEKFKDF